MATQKNVVVAIKNDYTEYLAATSLKKLCNKTGWDYEKNLKNRKLPIVHSGYMIERLVLN